MATPEKSFEVALSPREMEIGRLGTGQVGVIVDTPAIDALLPAGRLILRMTPGEARALAKALITYADAADRARPTGH